MSKANRVMGIRIEQHQHPPSYFLFFHQQQGALMIKKLTKLVNLAADVLTIAYFANKILDKKK